MAPYNFDRHFQDKKFSREGLNLREFERCVFTGCDFSRVNLIGATFIDCTFQRCIFTGAAINHVALRTAHFLDCDVQDVNFAMCDRTIFEIGFRNCRLDFSKFYALNLSKVQFLDCSLVGADFMKANLSESVFAACDLRRATFLQADLSKADFRGSFHYAIDPEKSKLKKARFSLAESVGLLEKYHIDWSQSNAISKT